MDYLKHGGFPAGVEFGSGNIGNIGGKVGKESRGVGTC